MGSAEGGRQEQAVPPECAAELAANALWTLLQQQQLGRRLAATVEPLSEASAASAARRQCGSGAGL